MTDVPFSQFKSLDIRVGRIVSIEDIMGSDKLYKIHADFGTERRVAIAGIKKHYGPEELIDKKFIFVLNLERRKIMGIESECMILAARDDDRISLLRPDKTVKEGSDIG
jgi:methionine--tRNA ligase beta chain